MPETVETKQEDVILINPFSVTRNGVSLTFNQHRVTRGKNAKEAKPYPAPDDEAKNEEVIAFVGADVAGSILKSFLKRMSQGWTDEATDDLTGEFEQGKFENLAASFSVMGETKSVLSDRLTALQGQLSAIPMSRLTIIMGLPDDNKEKTDFVQLLQRIQNVSMAIEKKKKKRTPEDEDAQAEPVSSV